MNPAQLANLIIILTAFYVFVQLFCMEEVKPTNKQPRYRNGRYAPFKRAVTFYGEMIAKIDKRYGHR